MSSSRPTQKIFSTISTLQKLRLVDKAACERPTNKYLSWLSWRWPGLNQETADEQTVKFNSTGLVADSIFLHTKLETPSLRQERLITSDGSCPAECMGEQQTSQLQPQLRDLDRERCELPIESKRVKGPVLGAKKTLFRRVKPDSIIFEESTTTKYSGLKAHCSERSKDQSYWVQPDVSTKTAGTEGGLRTYCVKTQTDTRSRTSTLSSRPSAFNTLKRLYSAKKDTTEKPKKPNKKSDEPVDLLKSKSPNECKKKRGKCDPNIKPFKNAAPSTPSPMLCQPAPMTPRATETGSLAVSFATQKRFYSDKKEAEAKPKDSVPEGEVQAKEAKGEKGSPVGEAPAKKSEVVAEEHGRCAKAKCAPASVECPKPSSTNQNQYRCPKKPVPTGRRKKRVKPVKMEVGAKKAK